VVPEAVADSVPLVAVMTAVPGRTPRTFPLRPPSAWWYPSCSTSPAARTLGDSAGPAPLP
jgi:hypothetical protein